MTTKRQTILKAQGMADHEDDVMVVFAYADGDYHIRAARDLDVELTGDDWMTRYGMRYVAVLTPTDSGRYSGMSAADVLRVAVAR